MQRQDNFWEMHIIDNGGNEKLLLDRKFDYLFLLLLKMQY